MATKSCRCTHLAEPNRSGTVRFELPLSHMLRLLTADIRAHLGCTLTRQGRAAHMIAAHLGAYDVCTCVLCAYESGLSGGRSSHTASSTRHGRLYKSCAVVEHLFSGAFARCGLRDSAAREPIVVRAASGEAICQEANGSSESVHVLYICCTECTHVAPRSHLI